MAGKHPAALGCDFLELWQEIRADLVPIVEKAYAGWPVRTDDIGLRIERHGDPEETHVAFSYPSVRDEAGMAAGLFCARVESTEQALSERRKAFWLTLEE